MLRARAQRGVTLVELMIAVTFLTVVAASTAMTYTMTMKSLMSSKTRGIASRLAQDKFETLRGYSYETLIVTPQSDLDISPGVDLTNYPVETYDMGGKSFRRSTIISRVYRNASNDIVAVPPDAADTGLKQIKVIVEYLQGSTPTSKIYTVLVSDPNVSPLNGVVYGLTKTTNSVVLPNVRVFVTENQNWYTTSSSTGYYQIAVDTLTYTVTATTPGYWDKKSASFNANFTSNQDLLLSAKSTGRVAGFITARPTHLLISSVFAGSASAPNSHFLELYNPTTAAILLTDGTSAKVQIKYIPTSNTVNTVSWTWGDSNPHSIEPFSYYLIATASPTINSVAPQGLFSSPATPFTDLTTAGVAIQDEYGVGLDTVGWRSSGSTPANGVETTGVSVSGTWGANALLVRATTSSGTVSLGMGNSVDNNNNSADIVVQASVGTGYPRSAATSPCFVYFGTAASSATVSTTDGYSAATQTSSTGYYVLNSVTTGTWSLSAYWTSFSSITPGGVFVTSTVTIKHLLLEPSSSGIGGVSGHIERSDTLASLPNITVIAGTRSTLTDANGNYVLALTSGTQTIEVNPSYTDANWDITSTTVAVPAGSVQDNVNFSLVPSGKASGKITSDGVSALTNVPVHAISLGREVATDQTDSSGNFMLYGIPAGVTMIEPVIDTNFQSASPASRSATITQGATSASNNFTITSGLGAITGTVKNNGTAITTGVLIVASTTTLTSLPTVDDTYRAGANILYATTSDSLGNFSVRVPKNSTYTVYGYFTTLLGTTDTNTTTASRTSVLVTSSSVVNLTW